MRAKQSNYWLYSIVLLLGACVLLPPVSGAAEVEAFASIAPQAFLVREIGGPLVNVEILVPPGQSPATYEPTPQQLTRLIEADVLFTTGVAFEERLVNKIADLGESKLSITPTHKDIELRPIERHDDDDNDHGHGTLDPHVWLDPKLAGVQANTIAVSLSELYPSGANSFQTNLERLLTRIDSVDVAIRDILTPVRGKTIYVFHPAYGYFADAYGLKQVAIETHGKEPSARQLAALIDQASRDSIDVVFVQPQFSSRQAAAIGQSIGASVETLDPLAGDYLNNLLEMASKIAQVLGGYGKGQSGVSEYDGEF